MKLPRPELAVVDIVKLRDYCLDPVHEFGKHKARVFDAALGLTKADASWLRNRLLEAVFADAEWAADTSYGTLYVIDFELRTSVGLAPVRSGWIVRSGENFPRLTTCYVKRNL